MENIGICLLIGLAGGFASGMVGLGGGIVIIPALVFFLKFSQHMAQGTTLALLLPPIGIFAVLVYYKEGYVDLRVAAIICLGFLFGSWFGARLATALQSVILEKIFATALLGISIKMLFFK